MRQKKEILRANLKIGYGILKSCELCPRRCRVDRVKGERGNCRAGLKPAVYSYFSHFGEEPPLSGSHGSGTIFFTHCTMHCVYCQNYAFSQLSNENEVSTKELAGMMLSLQRQGCHNINLVTPTHYVPQILEGLLFAIEEGLTIPVVYNASGYELVSTLRLLDGVIDVYLPDMRYGDDRHAKMFSDAPDYVKINQVAVKEMFRQVGNLAMDSGGIAKRGLMIRHLVLPNGIASSDGVFKFISENISKEVYISLMSQYYPAYKAMEFKEINRRITKSEYLETADLFFKYGFANGWIQDSSEEVSSKFLGTNIRKI